MEQSDLLRVKQQLPELYPFLQEMEEGLLRQLTLRRVPPDTLLYRQADWDESPLYILVYGVCRLFCDHEALLHPLYCPRGSVIGTLEALSGEFELRTANVSSFTRVELLSIPRRLLQGEVYRQHQGFFFWLVRHTILKYHRNDLSDFVNGDILFKLCGYFCGIYAMCWASTSGEQRELLLRDTQTRLAVSVGVSVRSMARSLSRMKESGLIENCQGMIRINETHYDRMQDFMYRHGF